MQAVRLKLAGGKPKVVPPDEAQRVWQGRQESPIRGAHRKVCTDTEGDAEAKRQNEHTANWFESDRKGETHQEYSRQLSQTAYLLPAVLLTLFRNKLLFL